VAAVSEIRRQGKRDGSAQQNRWRRVAPLLAPLLLLLLLPVGLSWIRGAEPELEPPSAAATATAAALMAATVAILSGSPDDTAPATGRWYVSVYPQAGGEPLTVLAQGPASSWAPNLRAAWPGKVQIDRAFADPPGPRRWLLRLGLHRSVDVGIDGWIEEGGRVHLPVSFVIAGYDRARLGRFIAEHPGMPLRTHAWVQGPEGPLRMLRHSVDPGPVTAKLVRERVALGARYLIDHQRADGLFDYEWDARSGQLRGEDYSLLRHAGTTYSLFQSSAFEAGEAARDAAVRGLELMRKQTRHAAGQPARCYLEDGDQVPLGGAAIALLALTEQARHHPADADRDWMLCLGEHLRAETDDRGDMRSFYAEPGRHRQNDTRSVYFPGEAVLALTRLNEVEPDPRWLDTALRAARYLSQERGVELGVRARRRTCRRRRPRGSARQHLQPRAAQGDRRRLPPRGPRGRRAARAPRASRRAFLPRSRLARSPLQPAKPIHLGDSVRCGRARARGLPHGGERSGDPHRRRAAQLERSARAPRASGGRMSQPTRRKRRKRRKRHTPAPAANPRRATLDRLARALVIVAACCLLALSLIGPLKLGLEATSIALLYHGALFGSVLASALGWSSPERELSWTARVFVVVAFVVWAFTWVTPLQELGAWVARVRYLWLEV